MRQKFWKRVGIAVAAAAMGMLFATSAMSQADNGQVITTLELKQLKDNQKCYGCHTDPKMKLKDRLINGRKISFFVDRDKFERSTHGAHICTMCHDNIKKVPHETQVERVQCTKCHYDGNTIGAPSSKEDVKRYKAYNQSAHKKALDKGNEKAAYCQDCHGTHDIARQTKSFSHINRKNLPQTCGKCHKVEYQDYEVSIHGSENRKGNLKTAICTDCHGEHNIMTEKSKRSTIFPPRVPDTCGKCHENKSLMRKFGIEADQYKTYRESFHGKAGKFGVVEVANCASCHGNHGILPPSDERSSVNKKNLARTCGKCHKGTTDNYTKGTIHIEASKKDAGIVYWIALMFKVLTIGTVLALVAHILMDLFRKVMTRSKHGNK